MARCGSRGCECTTCMDCGREHTDCICDLKKETIEFLEALNVEYEDGYHTAMGLLKRWASRG